jgi:hypothetical protein
MEAKRKPFCMSFVSLCETNKKISHVSLRFASFSQYRNEEKQINKFSLAFRCFRS